jgi:L-fuculose-phosphate aldolase
MLPYEEERSEVLETARKMLHTGHVVATSGNVSVRIKPKSEDAPKLYAITPSDMNYDEIGVEDIVVMNERGKRFRDAKGKRNAPSVEKFLHLGIYDIRADVNGIIHTHSVYPVTVSLLVDNLPTEELPPILEEQAIFLGGAIKIAEYAPTGSPQLAETVRNAIGDKSALILRHHGAVCVGKNLKKTFRNVQLLNKAAHVFLLGSACGKLTQLSPEALEYALRLYAATRQL